MATRVLRREKVLDSWGMLLGDAQGKTQQFFDGTLRRIQATQTPNVRSDMIEATPAIIKGMFGKKQPFLLVSNTLLKGFRMYVGARDYGNQLSVSWYLTWDPSLGFWGWVALLLFWPIVIPWWIIQRSTGRGRGPLDPSLDLFDEQELRDYATTVHHAVLEALAELMETLGKKVEIERRSRGFLGIS